MSRKTIQIPGLQDIIATLGRSEVQRIVNSSMRFGRLEGWSHEVKRRFAIDQLEAALEAIDADDVVTLEAA